MQKITTLFSFILLSINLSYAQVCEDCNKIKDYINVSIIQKAVTSDPNHEILKSYFERNTLETPLGYEEFSKVLMANNFIQTKEKLGDLINSIDVNGDSLDEGFAAKLMQAIESKLNDKQKKASDFNNLKGKLTQEINTYIKSRTTTDIPTDDSDYADDGSIYQEKPTASQDTTSQNVDFFSFSNFNFFTLLSLLIPLILFFILWIRVNFIYEKNERRKEEIKKLEQPDYSSAQNTSVKISKAEFESLLNNSNTFLDFHKAIETLQRQLTSPQHVGPSSANQQLSPEPSYNNADVFYMKYPVENTFSNNHKSFTKENTIYKFFVKANKNEAEFEIHTEGVRINEIISMVEKTIKTGCDEDNNPSANTRNIRTLKRGAVSLEGDRWIIKRKALIRYE